MRKIIMSSTIESTQAPYSPAMDEEESVAAETGAVAVAASMSMSARSDSTRTNTRATTQTLPPKMSSFQDDDKDNYEDGYGLLPSLMPTLLRIDPLLQFLTRATGQTAIPMPLLRRTFPGRFDAVSMLLPLQALVQCGILHATATTTTTTGTISNSSSNENNSNQESVEKGHPIHLQKPSWENEGMALGFPPPPSRMSATIATTMMTTTHDLAADSDTARRSLKRRKTTKSTNNNSTAAVDTIPMDHSTAKTTTIMMTMWMNRLAAARVAVLPPNGSHHRSLHGSTPAAAKRRVAALEQIIVWLSKATETQAAAAAVEKTPTTLSTGSAHEHGQLFDQGKACAPIAVTPPSPPRLQRKRTNTSHQSMAAVGLLSLAFAMSSTANSTNDGIGTGCCHQNDDIDEDVNENEQNEDGVEKNNEDSSDSLLDSESQAFQAVSKALNMPFYLSEHKHDQDDQSTATTTTAAMANTKSNRNGHARGKVAVGAIALRNSSKSHNISSTTMTVVDRSQLLPWILPRQLAYAGSHPEQEALYDSLSPDDWHSIPPLLRQAFGLAAPENCGDDANTISCGGANKNTPRLLYRHQVQAIHAALQLRHCIVCTGTGSGKSLCFLLPVLSAAYTDDAVSLIVFPTKALAQDQAGKLQALLAPYPDLAQRVRPATLDGDTPHASRAEIAAAHNIILTNPDTLHAALLPQWKNIPSYRSLLARLRYVVMDEAHLYEGMMGAHVAMITRRLVRLAAVAAATTTTTTTNTDTNPHQNHATHNHQQAIGSILDEFVASESPNEQHAFNPAKRRNLSLSDHHATRRLVFLAASATLPWPEQHFRLLFPISPGEAITVLGLMQDGSPRSTKHFLVWNPPLLSVQGHGMCLHRVDNGNNAHLGQHKEPTPTKALPNDNSTLHPDQQHTITMDPVPAVHGGNQDQQQVNSSSTEIGNIDSSRLDAACKLPTNDIDQTSTRHMHRRHPADETALLLTRAVVNGVRCIAFCKTRNLVEWVYERALRTLRNQPETAALALRVESYRGGYSMNERRKIEQRLFRNDLLGVVGTNALELGVDIGGIDLTLHCGYPSSYASLLQQAGRAGRGGDRLHVPSLSIMVCFNSAAEQHLWRQPKALLGQGITSANNIPINRAIVQSHLICAGSEFPLTGPFPVTAILGREELFDRDNTGIGLRSDHDLLGGEKLYREALEDLKCAGSVEEENVPFPSDPSMIITIYKTHPSMRKMASRLSIRSIEPVNYSVIDLSHPGQRGRMDGIYDENAVLDSVPYSRVFYHAHPGAIITHRGRTYKVVSMARPPAFAMECFQARARRSYNLAAYVKPAEVHYITRPLSNLHITVVKQLERVEVKDVVAGLDRTIEQVTGRGGDGTRLSTLAGCGAVGVKRSVHGYKKLSLITRVELSRKELSLPPMEYDTYGIWLDSDAENLLGMLGDKYGPGVHALAHAILAVAPIFASGVTRSDLECDHAWFKPTQVMLIDERAGGSGACERLWDHIFRPNGLIEAAIELLEGCSLCQSDSGYDGGCPACLHASNCIKFNMHLSRSAAIVIGKRMLDRIKETDLYKKNAMQSDDAILMCCADGTQLKEITPRRKARNKALQEAKELKAARTRQYVVGRPTWPMDGAEEKDGRQVLG